MMLRTWQRPWLPQARLTVCSRHGELMPFASALPSLPLLHSRSLLPVSMQRRQAPRASSAANLPVVALSPAAPSSFPAAPAQPFTRPVSVIRKIHRELESGERSAVEVAEEYLLRLRRHEDTLHSFLHWEEQQVLEQAREVDRALKGPEREKHLSSPLVGVPLAIKDNICTRDMPTTAGSRMLEGYRPPYDATAVERLRSRGALLLGKANMDEFGMGSSTEQSAFGVTRNPWANDRVPGGSSGGSGAAVAAGQCAAALGSDTGGSVRQPASFCGVVGLKPTYGRVSRSGLIAYASSLDVIGTVTQSVEDAALMLEAIAGHDPRDSTSSREPVPDFASALEVGESLGSSEPLRGVRLGLVQQTLAEGVDAEVVAAVRAAAREFEALGAEVAEVSLPSFALGLPAYYILAASEASSNLSRYDGVRYGLHRSAGSLAELYKETRGQGFGEEVKRRILMGTYALSAGFYDAYYKRAQQIRTLVLQDFSSALGTYDALITPTTPTLAFKIGEKTKDPLAMYAGDLMTVNVNLAGLPSLSLPCALAAPSRPSTEPQGSAPLLPVGLQLIGRAFGEAQLLKLGHVFEQTTSAWARREFN